MHWLSGRGSGEISHSGATTPSVIMETTKSGQSCFKLCRPSIVCMCYSQHCDKHSVERCASQTKMLVLCCRKAYDGIVDAGLNFVDTAGTLWLLLASLTLLALHAMLSCA